MYVYHAIFVDFALYIPGVCIPSPVAILQSLSSIHGADFSYSLKFICTINDSLSLFDCSFSFHFYFTLGLDSFACSSFYVSCIEFSCIFLFYLRLKSSILKIVRSKYVSMNSFYMSKLMTVVVFY